MGARGWSVTTISQPPLPGGGRGGCQRVVSDHQQSTLPPPGRGGCQRVVVTTISHPPLPPPVVLTGGSLGVGASGW